MAGTDGFKLYYVGELVKKVENSTRGLGGIFFKG